VVRLSFLLLLVVVQGLPALVVLLGLVLVLVVVVR
jgi:hypothetical protein